MYNELFNQKDKKTYRQRLRSEPTAAERTLWQQLQARRLDGHKFRRQQGVGPFIVDFYCPKAGLVIEVDGDSHFQPAAQTRDNHRETYLIGKGLRVLRFTDEQVLSGLEGVVDEIRMNLKGA